MRRPTLLFVMLGPVRAVSTSTMQAIDHAAIHAIGIPRILLMDRAGSALAEAVHRRLPPHTRRPVVVCCGMGFNGGDGLCAARYLAQWDRRVCVVLAGSRDRLRDEPAVYANILRALKIRMIEVESCEQLTRIRRITAQAALIVDALLGLGLRGTVRPLEAGLISVMNGSKTPIVAADVPSGLDADTGRPLGCAVHASLTVTFGLPKQGLLAGQGPRHCGALVVADLAIPPAAIRLGTRHRVTTGAQSRHR